MTTRIHHSGSQGLPHVVLPGNRVRQSDETTLVGVPRPVEAHGATVELVKDGDVVRAIDLICSCGQKTRVWCVYESE
jgi:hypothetical protein